MDQVGVAVKAAWLLPPPHRYLIVGSAPNLRLDQSHFTNHKIIAANGALSILWYQARVPVDYLCTTTHLYRDDATTEEIATRLGINQAARYAKAYVSQGLTTYVDMKNNPEVLHRVPGEKVRVYPEDREEIVLAALDVAQSPIFHRYEGRSSDYLRVSTGVWAACLAVAAGSPSVLITGIDPDSQGHWGADSGPGGLPRDHVEEDKAVLKVLIDNGLVEMVT